jgi:hypothetical protein
VPEQLLWNVQFRVVDGPQAGASGAVQVEAYDKLEVTVAAGTSLQVDLSPGAATSIRFLAIVPAVPDAQLTYDVGGKAIALDAPTFLLGGSVALAGDPTSVTFDNGTAAKASISILVGRDATP